MTASWELAEAGPGIVAVRFLGGSDDGTELWSALARRRPRVLLVEAIERWPERGPEAGALLAEQRVPVIAGASGEVPAHALPDLLAADVRVVGDSLAVPFRAADGGVLTEPATLARLAGLVGAGTAGYWVLARRRVDGILARDRGLADELVEDSRVDAVALDLAREVAAGAPLALEYAKEAVRRGERQRLDDALELEGDLYSILQTSADRREGVDAFLAGRKPRFRGD